MNTNKGLQTFFLELIIIFWYLKDVLINTYENIFNMIIVLLIYLCLKVVYYIFSTKKFSTYIMISIVLYIILASILYVDSIAYFLILNLTQLLLSYSKSIGLMSLLGIGIIYYIDLPIDSFILISSLIFITLYTQHISNERIIKLLSKTESSELALHKLSSQQLNMSVYESNLEHTTRLEERNEIAQKLHDELGHTLSGSTMQLEAALLVLDQNKDQAKDMFKRVINNLRDGTESIRKILKSIKPENASMNIQTIITLASKVKEKSGIHVDIIYNNELMELNYNQWQVIIMNVQESMTNMMKYSNATRCNITFELLNRMFKVSVIDNGTGCTTIKKGMGLQGITERMNQIDGQLILDGNNGFALVMLFKIKEGN